MIAATAVFLAISFGRPIMADVEQAPTRDQIEDKYKWDLTDFYASDEAWEEEYARLS
jgi:hypothetical protein